MHGYTDLLCTDNLIGGGVIRRGVTIIVKHGVVYISCATCVPCQSPVVVHVHHLLVEAARIGEVGTRSWGEREITSSRDPQPPGTTTIVKHGVVRILCAAIDNNHIVAVHLAVDLRAVVLLVRHMYATPVTRVGIWPSRVPASTCPPPVAHACTPQQHLL